MKKIVLLITLLVSGISSLHAWDVDEMGIVRERIAPISGGDYGLGFEGDAHAVPGTGQVRDPLSGRSDAVRTQAANPNIIADSYLS